MISNDAGYLIISNLVLMVIGDHLLFPLKCKSIVILSERGDG